MTTPDVDPLTAWPAFTQAVRHRLDAGRAAYSDRSFTAAPTALLAALEQPRDSASTSPRLRPA